MTGALGESHLDRRSALKAGSLALMGLVGAVGLLDSCQVAPSASSPVSQVPGSGGKAPRVVFISGKPSDSFVTAIKNGADQAAKDYELDYVFQASNNTTFPELIQVTLAVIASRPDGMAINYYDKTFEDSTTKALDAGIAVVLYTNNRFEGENAPSDPRIPQLAFVGQDESASGEKLASDFCRTSQMAPRSCTSIHIQCSRRSRCGALRLRVFSNPRDTRSKR